MDYGAIHHFLDNDFNEVDLFFATLNSKIGLLEQSTQNTDLFYRMNQAETHAKLKEVFDHDIAIAKTRYDEAYEEIHGSEQDKHSYASHVSDWDYLTVKYATDCEVADQHYGAMADILYTSQIISAYILLESELKQLCNTWQRHTGAKIVLADLGHRDYLAASRTYIDKVMGIEQSTLEEFENKLTDLQNLRNRLIHDNGLISGDQLKKVKKLIDSSKGGLVILKDGDGSRLSITTVDYVLSWYSVIRQFFEQLLWVIDASMSHRFLKNRLEYLFGFLNPHINVDIVNVQYDKPTRRVQFILNSMDAKALYDAEVLLEIKGSREQLLKVINKIRGNDQLDRFKKVMADRPEYFWNHTFSGWILTGKEKGAAIVIH